MGFWVGCFNFFVENFGEWEICCIFASDLNGVGVNPGSTRSVSSVGSERLLHTQEVESSNLPRITHDNPAF